MERKEPDFLGVRIGERRYKRFKQVAVAANNPCLSHFTRDLIDHVGKLQIQCRREGREFRLDDIVMREEAPAKPKNKNA